jgi:hypothetical protein
VASSQYVQLKHRSESLATSCFSLLADHVYMDKIREIYLPLLQINLIVYIIILGIRMIYLYLHTV